MLLYDRSSEDGEEGMGRPKGLNLHPHETTALMHYPLHHRSNLILVYIRSQCNITNIKLKTLLNTTQMSHKTCFWPPNPSENTNPQPGTAGILANPCSACSNIPPTSASNKWDILLSTANQIQTTEH